MSRSATPATRNEATRRLKPPKVTPIAELTIGTGIATSRCCGRLGNVERTHPQLPHPQSETGSYAFGKMKVCNPIAYLDKLKVGLGNSITLALGGFLTI